MVWCRLVFILWFGACWFSYYGLVPAGFHGSCSLFVNCHRQHLRSYTCLFLVPFYTPMNYFSLFLLFLCVQRTFFVGCRCSVCSCRGQRWLGGSSTLGTCRCIGCSRSGQRWHGGSSTLGTCGYIGCSRSGQRWHGGSSTLGTVVVVVVVNVGMVAVPPWVQWLWWGCSTCVFCLRWHDVVQWTRLAW